MMIKSLILKILFFLLTVVPSGLVMEIPHKESKEISKEQQHNPMTPPFPNESMHDEATESEKPERHDATGSSSLSQEEQAIPERTLLSRSAPSEFYSEHWGGIRQADVDHLFENSSYYIGISTTSRFKRVNKNLQEATGWSEEEFIKNPFSFFWHPDETSKFADYIEYTRSRLATWGFELRKKRKDGSYIWVEWLTLPKVIIPLLGALEDQEYVWIGKDITQQKEQEEENRKELDKSHQEIKSLNRRFQERNKILQAISSIQSEYIERKSNICDKGKYNEDVFYLYYDTFDFILKNFIELTESDFGFIGALFFNEDQPLFMQQIFGLAPNVMVDDWMREAMGTYKGRSRKLCNFDNIFGEIISDRKPVIVNDVKNYSKIIGIPPSHTPIKTCLGIPFIFKNKVVGIVVLANRSEGYNEELLQWLEPLSLVTGRIINELRMEHWREEAEKERIARERAEASSAAKSVFLAHMSHEIRTPLTGILGLLDLINKKSLSQEDLSYLQSCQMSGWSLVSLLNDILDASKIEANQIKLEKIEVEPVKIIQEVIKLLSLEGQKQETSLTVTLNPGVPPILIGDPTRLRQIYINLIGNAIKFTKRGSVTVTIGGQESTETKNTFVLKGTVTDTGIGIKPETQQRLFQPFSQADESMMRQFGGTGLGLFITKKLCDLMGGNIKVSSQFGVGSTFEFNIQMQIPEEQPEDLFVSPRKTRKLPKLKILIAEDNSLNQLVLKTLLNREGCTTTVVINGLEAIEAVQKEEYDLILMDGEMPEMDGLEATRRIRQMPQYQSLPIIGVTGHALDMHREKFLDSGMNGYLTKPLNKETLRCEILRCLKSKTTRQGESSTGVGHYN